MQKSASVFTTNRKRIDLQTELASSPNMIPQPTVGNARIPHVDMIGPVCPGIVGEKGKQFGHDSVFTIQNRSFHVDIAERHKVESVAEIANLHVPLANHGQDRFQFGIVLVGKRFGHHCQESPGQCT